MRGEASSPRRVVNPCWAARVRRRVKYIRYADADTSALRTAKQALQKGC